MATTLAPHFTRQQPRSSAETDRRHLLADSVAPSAATSVIDYAPSELGDGDRTPRAHSPSPPQAPSTFRIPAGERRDTIADPSAAPRPYKGFPSEAHYLAALHDWAESKKYIQPSDATLYGFFGPISMEEYASRPKIEGLGLKKKWRARKEAKEEARTARRNTVT